MFEKTLPKPEEVDPIKLIKELLSSELYPIISGLVLELNTTLGYLYVDAMGSVPKSYYGRICGN